MKRFWDKVQKTDGCWLWTASRAQGGHGYGTFQYEGRLHHAHRVAWFLLRGPLEAGVHLHHECREVLCVNPEHLRPVSPLEHKAFHLRDRCKNGHEWTSENTYHRVDRPGRECRICRREALQRFRERAAISARQTVLNVEKELAR